MAKLTVWFGILLIALGLGFFALNTHAPTSLIPTIFGVLLAALGSLAATPDAKRRMLFMHIAVTVGLLGFLFPLIRSLKPAIAMMRGETVLRPRAVEEQILMALICLVFTGLCVRSFIAARRARLL